jgi:hypothetical protein
MKKSLTLFAVLLILTLGSCVSVNVQQPQPVAEPVTPTPEVFNPLDPSPTPSNSTLPLTCQLTDLNVYVNEEAGYCFAYPMSFTMDEGRATEGIVSLYGPALEENANPVRASLELTTQPVAQGSALTPLVDAYLTSFSDTPFPITRAAVMLGSEPAEMLEPVPGLLSSRVVLALHEDILFTLRFHPSDLDIAKPDLEALTQTVTGSFAFFAKTTQPSSQVRTISWFEFGTNISLSYDSTLAPWVEAQTVPAVSVSDQIMFAESHPAYAQIRFVGFQGGRSYDLPMLPRENNIAQVMVFQTADFPGFGDDSPQGFVAQMQALNELLASGVDAARCAQPLMDAPALPFLPWVNSKQSLCAQPRIIEFTGGSGIRYLTYYSQDPSPVLDQKVFYTFQGLTDDGKFHVSAAFPIQTGIFPTEAPACPKCGEPDYNPFEDWNTLLSEQLTQLNAQPEDDFAPSLQLLDELIHSIQIGQ